MAERIAAFDWERTALGSQRMWPSSLRLMLGVALRTRFPMLIFWGPDLIQMYNDAFVPILGARHPAALGQRGRDCWPEVWDAIGPLLTGALEEGIPAWGEDWPFTLERNGFPEATNFTFSYSQFGEPGEAGGVLCTCVETTKAVRRAGEFRALTERRANTSGICESPYFAGIPKRPRCRRRCPKFPACTSGRDVRSRRRRRARRR